MLYIFDIDGTLIRSYMREGRPISDYGRVDVLPRRHGKIKQLASEKEACFALASNQAGVAMGHVTERQVWKRTARVLRELRFFYGRPVSVHICMHHPRSKLADWQMDPCPRRKPEPGLLIEAMEAHNVFTERTIFVGDMDTDRAAAAAAGVPYVDAAEFFRAES